MQTNVARLMKHLVQMRDDDPQLAHLAAAAVLMAKDCHNAADWSTEEMQIKRSEVKRLEDAWGTFFGMAGLHHYVTDSSTGSAALHLAFKEMQAAVRGGAPIPTRDELVVKIARSALGNNFRSVNEVEEAVRAVLAGVGHTLDNAGVTCLAAGQVQCGGHQLGRGSVSHAATFGGSLLPVAATSVH